MRIVVGLVDTALAVLLAWIWHSVALYWHWPMDFTVLAFIATEIAILRRKYDPPR